MVNEAPYHGTVLLLNLGLVVAAVRPGTGELDAATGAVLDNVLLMNTLSLSESIPRMGKGSC